MAGGVNVALCWSRQVEAALTNDPSNEELLKLRDDLTVSEYSAHLPGCVAGQDYNT